MELITSLEKEFLKAQNPLSAAQMSAYMRNKFPFFGIKKPHRAALQKDIFSRHIIISENDLTTIVNLLWAKAEREYQMTACDLAFFYKKLWTPRFLQTIEELIRTKSWWNKILVG